MRWLRWACVCYLDWGLCVELGLKTVWTIGIRDCVNYWEWRLFPLLWCSQVSGGGAPSKPQIRAAGTGLWLVYWNVSLFDYKSNTKSRIYHLSYIKLSLLLYLWNVFFSKAECWTETHLYEIWVCERDPSTATTEWQGQLVGNSHQPHINVL